MPRRIDVEPILPEITGCGPGLRRHNREHRAVARPLVERDAHRLGRLTRFPVEDPQPCRRHIRQSTAIRGKREHAQAVLLALGHDSDVDRPPTDREAILDIDVVGTVERRDRLTSRSVRAKGVEPAFDLLLVCTENQAPGWFCGVNPDRRVIRIVGNSRGLCDWFDGRDCRWTWGRSRHPPQGTSIGSRPAARRARPDSHATSGASSACWLPAPGA